MDDETLDFETKNQNFNMRLTPSMKSLIISNAKKIGLSITDYIEHCVQLHIDSDNALEKLNLYKKESERYNEIIDLFQEYYATTNNGKPVTSHELFVEVMRLLKKLKPVSENN